MLVGPLGQQKTSFDYKSDEERRVFSPHRLQYIAMQVWITPFCAPFGAVATVVQPFKWYRHVTTSELVKCLLWLQHNSDCVMCTVWCQCVKSLSHNAVHVWQRFSAAGYTHSNMSNFFPLQWLELSNKLCIFKYLRPPSSNIPHAPVNPGGVVIKAEAD